MDLVYDKPYKVNSIQYDYCMENFSGMVAGRFDKDNLCYLIKVWIRSQRIENYFKKEKIGLSL